MSSSLDLLRRFDRCELADNRMTLFAPGFGLGSIHFWDGSWDNDEDETPWQSNEVFENRDGLLEVLHGGRVELMQMDQRAWLPHSITTRLVGHRASVWEETKAIHDDVSVDIIRYKGGGLGGKHSQEATICHRIEKRRGLKIMAVSQGVHVIADSGSYAGVHRFLGFSGAGKVTVRDGRGEVHVEVTVPLVSELWKEIAYVVACGEKAGETQERFRAALKDPKKSITKAHQRWERFFDEQVPRFECDNEKWMKLYNFSFYVLRSNLYDFKKGAIQHPFSCPSKFRLMPSWFWDPCFHGFNEKWLRDYPAPISTFRNHIGAQEKNGYLPMTLDARGNTWAALGGIKQACQQFLYPITVWDNYLVHGDKQVLRELLDPMAEHDRFLAREREVGDLFVPQSGGEIADNSSRLVASPGHRETLEVLSHKIQPIDWNTFQMISERLMARMAREVGRRDLVSEMTKRADIKEKALRGMWNPKTKLFADRWLPSGKHSSKRIPEGMLSMLGGYASKSQIASMVKFLTDPKELWTKYPVPTMPLSDPEFICDDVYQSYWNGRVWPCLNWCYVESLSRGGQHKVARELMERNLDMFMADGEPNCMENFNPIESKRYAPPHSAFNQGWGTMGVDLILRRGLGLQLNAPKKEVSFAPLGLPGVTEASVDGVPFGRGTLNVKMKFPKKGKASIKIDGRAKLVSRADHWLAY